MVRAFHSLTADESGFVVSAEVVLVLTIAVLGMVVGLTAVRDAVTQELNDLAHAFGAVSQTYKVGGLKKGRDYGLSVLDDYDAIRYHKAADNFDPTWDLRGIVQDLNALYGVGKILSLNQAWPNYREGNAFRAVRDASRAQTRH